MKVISFTLNQFRKLLELIKQGNPPEGKTKEEWINEIKQLTLNSYRGGNCSIDDINFYKKDNDIV